MRKVVEGERSGRPQGREEVWFTDDLWEILEQCWLPQPDRRPTIDTVLQCLKQGSTAWQPLPPDPDDYAQSDSDDQSDFTLNHDPSVNPSMLLRPFLNLAHPQTVRIDPQNDDRTAVPSQNEPSGVYAGQDSHQPSPESQQRLAELPVSVALDATDTFVLYENP